MFSRGGKRVVSCQSLRPSFRIRRAKHPPPVTLFLHHDDNNLILWFRLTRILLLQIGYQQNALHSRDYSILKLWNLQKTQIVAAPSTSLLIANPPAVPIVSSARMTVTEFCYSHSLDLLISPYQPTLTYFDPVQTLKCNAIRCGLGTRQCLTNEILGSTLNPDWDDHSQQIAYAVSLHPCLPHANPGRWVPSIMDSIMSPAFGRRSTLMPACNETDLRVRKSIFKLRNSTESLSSNEACFLSKTRGIDPFIRTVACYSVPRVPGSMQMCMRQPIT